MLTGPSASFCPWLSSRWLAGDSLRNYHCWTTWPINHSYAAFAHLLRIALDPDLLWQSCLSSH